MVSEAAGTFGAELELEALYQILGFVFGVLVYSGN